MKIKECIALLKELKEITFVNDSDKKKLLKHIKPSVLKLRDGKNLMKELETLVIEEDYDKAVKTLRRKANYTKFWPLNELSWSDLGPVRWISGFLILIGLINISIWIFEFRHTKDSENWPQTTGIIVYSEVYENSNDDGGVTSYSPLIEFTYTVYGKSYKSDYYTFVTTGDEKEWADSIVKQHPVNSLVTVYYHPKKHRLAVIEPGFDPFIYGFPISGYSIFFIGLVIISIKIIIETRLIKKYDTKK